VGEGQTENFLGQIQNSLKEKGVEKDDRGKGKLTLTRLIQQDIQRNLWRRVDQRAENLKIKQTSKKGAYGDQRREARWEVRKKGFLKKRRARVLGKDPGGGDQRH